LGTPPSPKLPSLQHGSPPGTPQVGPGSQGGLHCMVSPSTTSISACRAGEFHEDCTVVNTLCNEVACDGVLIYERRAG
jgi:hypothetical protein